MPPASRVLRRALFVWGLGHLAIGDRRGWLWLIAQPFAIGAFLLTAVLLIDSTRWMLVLPALLVLLAVWLGQALDAYRRAIELGARRGGELQITLFLPLVVVLVTAFWLFGGMDGSPATTVRRYVSAWEAGDPASAGQLFVVPVSDADLKGQWTAESSYLEQQVTAAAAQYPLSGVDPDEPFNSLQFTELDSSNADSSSVRVDIIRRERVQTVLLGFIPTATQQTVVVEQLGTINLRALPAQQPAWLPLPFVQTGGRVWRIDSVQLTMATGDRGRQYC